MSKNLFKHTLRTEKEQQFIDLTEYVDEAIHISGVEDGILTIYCPHTTAGITVNENADPDVVYDMLSSLNKIFPVEDNYRHFEGNSHAHLKSSFVGVEKTFIVSSGRVIKGIWQSPYFCEFDGPRDREFYIKIVEG